MDLFGKQARQELEQLQKAKMESGRTMLKSVTNTNNDEKAIIV